MPARRGAGRPAKPTALKKLHGTARPSRINHLEPQPIGDLTEPPEWLTDAQQDSWRYHIQHCPKGVLKILDRGTLAMFCAAETRHRDANMQLARHNAANPDHAHLTVDQFGNLKLHPLVVAIDKAAAVMLRCIPELGFSPSSRTRLKVIPEGPAPAEQKPADPWDTLKVIPGGKAA